MKEYKIIKKCRICGSKNLHKFLDFGQMSLANNFLTDDELNRVEARYPLYCLFCANCGLVQLGVVVNPRIMFCNYPYIPSGSGVMMNNFASLAYEVGKRMKFGEKSLVIDIGSNDGTLLTFFKKMGTRILGVDPAKNLSRMAQLSGVPTVTKLFNRQTAKSLVNKYGKADLVLATNVVAHIDDLYDFLRGVSTMLGSRGLFICEFPYVLDLIARNQFDTIYHEHLSYFALLPWSRIVSRLDFEIVDVARLSIHGGSLRLTHKKKSGTRRSKAVDYLVALERRHGLYDVATYEAFAKRIEGLGEKLKLVLGDFKTRGKRIIGLGAAAKGNVLTNFFDIGGDILDYIADSTPYKWGLYTPGKHIAIYPEERVEFDLPDFGLILAWNFANEIMRKHQQFKKRGGKFIIPIPEVKII
ncbi:methyltransferase domain-containing protein [Candidatus Curtissbacteria bacterium]|nr:methyltransferase domain-containing protein [Candidatus Curtissbacteria bacterium]